MEIGEQLTMIDLNVRAVVDLSARLLPASHPAPGRHDRDDCIYRSLPADTYLATYGATKAFVPELVTRTWRTSAGLKCLAVCPGPPALISLKAAGFETSPWIKAPIRGSDMTSDEVAAYTLRAIAKERPSS